ncbi:MAG: zinc ribbon domain-containing protein [Oscillospiraceae bacterium]|jgi:RNA polymerase subunit RPABC4/transcription elongation factor Spt4|nr:zinc ribbon domain-containing protein [Oscillospiraceae bacterium]
MGFFDDFGKKVSEVADDVSSSVKGLADAARLNAQISAEKKKADAALLDLGRRYFDAYRDTPPEGLAEVFAAAKTSLARVAELERELVRSKGQKLCPACGEAVLLSTNFCPKCGAGVPSPEPPVQQAEAAPVCSGCGAPLTADTAFCGVCGVPNTAK